MKTSAGILQGANYEFTMKIPPDYHESLIHEAIAHYNSSSGGDMLTQYFHDQHVHVWLYESRQVEIQELIVRIAAPATVALYNLEGGARLLTRGRGALDIEANSYQIFRLQPDSHRLELAGGRHLFFLLFLSPSIQSLMNQESIVAPYTQPPSGPLGNTQRDQLLSIYQPELKGDIWRLKRQVLLLDVLFHTLDDAGVQYRLEDMDVYHNNYQTLNRVKSYIAENIDKKLSISHLAKRFGVQPTQLRRGYYRVFHQHLCDYIRDLRLDTARRLLTQTGLPVQEIAWEVGYESAAGFSRVFSHYYQQAPIDVRR